MIPEKFKSQIKEWRGWRVDVEEYVEGVDEQIRKDLDLVRKSIKSIDRDEFARLGGGDFDKGRKLFRFLKARTEGSGMAGKRGGD